jgi:hypothetical protein
MKKVSFYGLLAGFSLLILSPTQTFAGGLSVPSSLKLDRFECGQALKSYAYISWNPVEHATSYRFYTKFAGESFGAYDDVATNSYKLDIKSEFEVKVAVSAVNTYASTAPTPEVLESDKSTELTLSVRELAAKCKESAASPTQAFAAITTGVTDGTTPSAQPKIRLTITPTPSPKTIGNLRADDIEISDYVSSPTAEAERPTTEEMFGSLVKWITSRVPFFRKN